MPIDFIQVAFAGHNRSEDLGDAKAALRGLRQAFALLAEAGAKKGRLLTGLAQGADLLAARAWRDQGLGTVHAVFPFLDDNGGEGAAALMDSASWLDGAAAEATGRNPHLAQTRWVIGAADLLVVVWTGARGRGAGGTADAVHLALERGVPVLWIKSTADGGGLRLIRPEHLYDDFAFLEFLEELAREREPLVTPATAETLRQALAGVSAEQTLPAETADDNRPLLPIWRTYAVLRKLIGGTAPPFELPPTPPDLASQRGFTDLTAAQAQADARASRLGAVHRSQQVILLLIAILGAAVGSSSAMWPSLDQETVLAELGLAVGALLVWRAAVRGAFHEQWGAARRLAEDLRLERVAWSLGVSTATRRGEFSAGARARQVRRHAGLPEGRFDPERVRSWGGWAIGELIAGQGAYHRAQAQINGHIAHRVHQTENVSFVFLMIVLTGYSVLAAVLALQHAHTPQWAQGLAVMTSTIVPAIGAASLAMEATLSLEEQAHRSHLLAQRLQTLLEDLGPAPGMEALQAGIVNAIALARAQEDHWLEGAGRRKLYRGG